MKMIQGSCIYCGQSKMVEAADIEDANKQVTRECGCDEAVRERQKKELGERIRAAVSQPEKESRMMPFSEQQQEDAVMFAEKVFEKQYPAIQYSVNDCTVTITDTKNGVEFIRSKKIKEVT